MNKLLFISTLLFSSLHATSFALYAPYYSSEYELSGESNSNVGNSPQEYEASIGIGLAYDSSLTNSSFFNYRLGLEYIELHKEVSNSTIAWSHDKEKIVVISTFGFSLYKSNTSRFWIGPSIFFNMDTTTENEGTFKTTYTDYTIGATPITIGYNYTLKNNFTLSIDANYNLSYHSNENSSSLTTTLATRLYLFYTF